jgi:hypothetical protein
LITASLGSGPASAAPQVGQRGDGLRVRPLEVVDDQDDRSVLGHDRHQRLEDLDLVDVRLRARERELGKHPVKSRERQASDRHIGQRLAQSGRQRHVGQVRLEL